MIRGFSNHASDPMNKKLTSMALAVSSCFGAGHAVADDDTRVLSPVVVTATRVEQDSFDLPMAIDKIERQNIDNQLRMTLSESLARIPGITAQNRNQMAQDPQISSRGFGARSSFGVRGIRVYVDGIPLSMPDGIGNPVALIWMRSAASKSCAGHFLQCTATPPVAYCSYSPKNPARLP